MFTGLVSHKGYLTDIIERDSEDVLFAIKEEEGMFSRASEGDSIMCNGVCLTVTSRVDDTCSFRVSRETLRRTTLGSWREGRLINLESSMTIGDSFGGHIVCGHVDTIGKVLSIEKECGSYKYGFEVVGFDGALVARKGCVAVDGISLTVNELESDRDQDRDRDQDQDSIRFWVNVLEYTYRETNLFSLLVGDIVNLEEDIMLRYVSRILEWKRDR